MRRSAISPLVMRSLRLAGAMALVAALSGCIVAPYGPPRYGYYHPWHPYHYGYY